MISLTHLIFGLALAYILDKRLVTATVFSIVPDFDITLNFLYPFTHRGIMHTFLAAFVFSILVYTYSEDLESAKSCFLGYSSHLFLDLLTFSGLPLFFPFFGDFRIGIASAYSLTWNSAIISLSLGFMFMKKHEEVFRPVINFR